MIALLSDVHANLEALQAVYADLIQRGLKRIFFLGDIVGYGPNPREVLEFIKHFEFSLLGNHDEAVLKGPPRTFNPLAQRATRWTRGQICPDEMSVSFLRPGERQQRQAFWAYLQSLKPVRLVQQTMFVHDTPVQPGSWRYVRTHADAEKAFAAHPHVRLFFVGHSHIPRVWTERATVMPEPGQKFPFKGRMVISVGSVGQPRDKDPRACYVLLEADGVRFLRIAYPLEKTQQKIRANPELDPFLADRLAKGI